jgi:hypothetical protein
VTVPVLPVATIAVRHADRPPAVGDTSDDSRGHGRSARTAWWTWGSRQARQSPRFGRDGSAGSRARAGDARVYLLQTSASLRIKDLPRANRAERADSDDRIASALFGDE